MKTTVLTDSTGVSAVLATLGGDIDPAIEALGVPTVIIDRGGRIRHLNQRGRGLMGDLRGRPFTDLLAPESHAKARLNFAKNVLGTETVTDTEHWLRTRGGTVLAEIHVVAIEAGEHVVGVFGIAIPAKENIPRLQAVRASALTPRQTEVLSLLAEGRSTAQIADELSISVETVRNHIRGILRTLGVRSKLEAVVRAIRLGLLE